LDDLIQEFLVESNENLDRLDSELVKLESDPTSAYLLASISGAGSCGRKPAEQIAGWYPRAHTEISSALLTCGDGIRQMLAAISATGQDGEELYSELIETLKRLQDIRPIQRRIDIVPIGTSTGGPNALGEVIPALPADLAVPVVVVQHMPALFTRMLAKHLDARAKIPVQEGRAGIKLQAGAVWIAPGDYHMTLVRGKEGVQLAVNQDPPEHSCRPSVDPLFRSGARTLVRPPSQCDDRNGLRRCVGSEGDPAGRWRSPDPGSSQFRGMGHARSSRSCRGSGSDPSAFRDSRRNRSAGPASVGHTSVGHTSVLFTASVTARAMDLPTLPYSNPQTGGFRALCQADSSYRRDRS
jgi:hypothetical protein